MAQSKAPKALTLGADGWSFAWGENIDDAMRARLSHESVGWDVMGCAARKIGLETGERATKGRKEKRGGKESSLLTQRGTMQMHSCMHALCSSSGDRKA